MNKFRGKTAWVCISYLLPFFISCNHTSKQESKSINHNKPATRSTYAYDADFLKHHRNKLFELVDASGSSKVLLSADDQGRVMTSTAAGDSGISFGWLNYDLIAGENRKKQFNPVGGEERFWLGPEGGQYSLYFKSGDSFSLKNWQVPPIIDTSAYSVVQAGRSQVIFAKQTSLTNYSGTNFQIFIERKISLLNNKQVEEVLQQAIPAGVRFVGFETVNRVTNAGNNDWQKEKGLLSIWLLGMFRPTDKTVVIIPFHGIYNARSYITDNYFGQIPANRLQVKDSILFFICDGRFRSKIGLSPIIAKPLAASFDFDRNVLTVVIPEITKNASYVNSKWELQTQPYKGDVINSYNDGPLPDGKQLGFFYEIESSSPALQLKKGQTGRYKQTTIHFQGSYDSLKQLAKQLLGIDLDEIGK